MNVQHDKEGHRFFIQLTNGEEAILRYNEKEGALDFYHTYVPPSARVKGMAEKLVEAGFEYAKENNLKVIPTCPYVSVTFLRRRREYLDLVQN